MPKTKSKEAKLPGIRRVKSKEDRKRPSVFMRLKTDEAFKGVALFEPDPELDDNPGYFEYYDHFDKQANQYVPCAGDACPFCAANDNPSTRALTAWYFPEAGDKKDQIKIFTMNYSTINDIADEAEEEGGILGKTIRIKRLSDKGDYKVRIISAKPLTKSDLKKVMALLAEKLKEVGKGSLEGIVLRQLQTQLERLKAMEALDDDDDDDDDDEPKAKGNSRKGRVVEEDDDDEDDDGDEDEDESDDEEDEDEDESDEEDEDEDEDDEDDEEEEDEEEEAESSEISGVEYEVVKVNEKDEIFDLKNDDEKVKMWLGDGVEVDYDEIKKGVKVSVDAATDDEGDWVISAISLVKAKGGKTKGKTKGGKKK